MKHCHSNQLSSSLNNLFLVSTLIFSASPVYAKKRNRNYQPKNPSSSEEYTDSADHSQENGSGSAGKIPFPKNPEDSVTPGSLCATPSEYRYPEKIKYCNRDVESELKREVIADYDKQFGYRIQQMNRGDFKIDHLIPLCAGGSNEKDNLWPQHKTVYVKTDRIEESVCRLMAVGQMTQAQAVDLVLDVKHNLQKADRVLSELLSKLN